MLRLALGTVGSRKGGVLGALVGVTLAAALVVSCGIVLESTLRAGDPVERLAAAAIVVQRGPSFHLPGGANDLTLTERTSLDGRLAARLGTLPGVARAVADRTFPAELALPRHGGRPLFGGAVPGHGWSSAALAPLELRSGHAPRNEGELVLDAGLVDPGAVRVGDRLRVATVFGRGLFTVVGIVAPQAAHGASRVPAAYFRDDVAQRFAGTGGRAGLIGIVLRSGADRDRVAEQVRRAVEPQGLRVLTGGARGGAESPERAVAREDVLTGLSAFASIAVFVAVFVVASAFALSVQQRHRELALLRAIGATPRQVRRMIAGESLGIAVAGAVLAAPLAVALAHGERRLFVHIGLLPADVGLVVSWIPFAVGLAAAVVTTQLATLGSARRASRIRPVDALREAAVEGRPVSLLRGLAGLAAVVVGIAVFAATAQSAGGGGGDDAPAAGLVWMVAAVLLGPLLALPFVRALGLPIAALGRGPGMLARANSLGSLRRLTSVATPLMLTVSLGCALVVSRTTVERETDRQVAASLRADQVLVPARGEALSPDLAAAARRVPGVRDAAGLLTTSVVVDGGGGNPVALPSLAVDASAFGGALDLGVSSGSLANLRGPSIAVDRHRARQLGWRLGDRVALWLGDGMPARLRVVALFERPLGFGEVAIPRTLARTHVSDPRDQAVLVTAGGAAGATLRSGLERLAAALPPEVVTRGRYVHDRSAELRRQSHAVYTLLGVVILFAAVAAVNALSMAISERARELELLRLVGATRRQLTRMVQLELLVIVAFATVLGALTAAPGLVAFSYGKTGSLVPAVPAWLFGGVPVTVALLAFAASVLPTRRALRGGRGSVTAGAE
jgi:putative ABC transport system permease protein